MISDLESRFLSSALSEIPTGSSVADIEFIEDDFEEYKQRFGDEEDSSFQPSQFFVNTGKEVCQKCDRIGQNCNCPDSDRQTVYHLDLEFILKQWCNQLEQLEQYEDLYIEEDGPPLWEVKLVSREFGIITFFVVSKTDQLDRVEPDFFNQEFVISLVEDRRVENQDHCYMWYQLCSQSQHEDLHAAIRDTLSPLSDGICDLDSTIAMDNQNAITNNLRKYFTDQGFHSADPQREIGNIGRTIDFPDISYCGKSQEHEVVLICGCEKSANDLHLHYISGGEIEPVSECPVAETGAKKMRGRLDRRETLEQRTSNMSGRMKALALGIATVSLGPIIATVAGLVGSNWFSNNGYPFIPELVISVVLLFLFTALILPSVQISLFSWDIRSYRSRIRSIIPYL